MKLWLFFVLFALTLSCGKDEPVPVTVDITFPTEGDVVRINPVLVKGTATGTSTVDVNGEVTDVIGGEWELPIKFDQGAVDVNASFGAASDNVGFIVDSFAPKIVVESPTRGQYVDIMTDSGSLVVSGSVSDQGAGVDTIRVNERIVEVDTEGRFEYTVTLEPGVNEIDVTAKDRAGNLSSDVRGVMFGDFVSPISDIDPGFLGFIQSSGVEVIKEVALQILTPESLTSIAETVGPDGLVLRSLTFDPPDLDLVLKTGRFTSELEVTNLAIDGTYTVGGTDVDAIIEVARAKIIVDVIPFATDDGGLSARFENEVIEIEENDISFDIAGFTDEDSEFLRGLITDFIRAGFSYALSQNLIDGLWDPNVLIREAELLGRKIVFEAKFSNIDVFPDAAVFETIFVLPADKFEGVRDVPGALNRLPAADDGTQPRGDIAFSTTEYTIDRLLHGIWRSGLFHLALTGDSFAGFELPFTLDAGGLGLVLDSRITTLAPPETPATIQLRPQLPPVAEFDDENDKLTIRIGEFFIDFLLSPPNQEPIKVVTLSAFLELGVTVSFEGFLINLSFDTTFKADVADEPQFDVDDEKTEQLFEDVIALIPQILQEGISLKGVADITWVTLSDMNLVLHGPEKDHVSFGLKMEANPDGLTTP